MKELSMTLQLGATAPFKLLHVSDTHLVYADERDDERKLKLARRRSEVFPNAEADMIDTGLRAKKEHALIVHTGDLIDFVSWKNLDAARLFCFDNDCFMAAGNHEFSQYVGEAKEDAAYRNQSLEKVQACFKNDIRCAVREINGVKLIALDNSYYLFDEYMLDTLKHESADGKPIILLMHTPLFTPELHDYMINTLGHPCAYLCGTPENLLKSYPPERYIQQKPDEITLATIDFIKCCPEIKCILTGHIHKDFVGRITPALTQYAVGLDTSTLIEVR